MKTITIENMPFMTAFKDFASTIMDNGTCVKRRYGEMRDFDIHDLDNSIRYFSNIVTVINDDIDIYCQNNIAEILIEEITCNNSSDGRYTVRIHTNN